MISEQYKFSKIEELRRACGSDTKLSSKDADFARSLCDNYFARTYLSEKQWYWVEVLLERAGALPTETGSKGTSETEEVFDGTKIQELFKRSASKLKYPRLKYQTDEGSKIVFSYVTDAASKWAGCTFVDNGGKEGKKRYGFIGRHGQGKLNRDAPPEVKTLIRRIATAPTEVAKLSGQKYANCCFCGLELLNKSSVYHGYGPICAENWGLPWGDTGDIADEEAAAQAELKHIQLVDLGESK